MQYPVYVPNEPPYKFIMKLEAYEASQKKDKYDGILKFINKIANKKYIALCDFKGVKEKELKSGKELYKIYKSDGRKLAKKLDIKDCYKKIKEKIKEIEKKEDIKIDNLIVFLRNTMKTIGYSLIRKTIGDSHYYTIKN
jgi:hypothetical protein